MTAVMCLALWIGFFCSVKLAIDNHFRTIKNKSHENSHSAGDVD